MASQEEIFAQFLALGQAAFLPATQRANDIAAAMRQKGEAEQEEQRRAKSRGYVAKHRAKRKQAEAASAMLEPMDVPSMDDTPVVNDVAGFDSQEPPEVGNIAQAARPQRADRLELNKQTKTPAMVAEYLRVHLTLGAAVAPECKVCASPDVRFGRRGSTDVFCHDCSCQDGEDALKATEFVDLKDDRVLHPVELPEGVMKRRYWPLTKSCPTCRGCQWHRKPEPGKETVIVELDGIWRYAAASHTCLGCGHQFDYTNPLTYTTATHLPGKPVIANTAVAIQAIEHFITMQRHCPQFSPSAFINCRLPVTGVRSLDCCQLVVSGFCRARWMLARCASA